MATAIARIPKMSTEPDGLKSNAKKRSRMNICLTRWAIVPTLAASLLFTFGGRTLRAAQDAATNAAPAGNIDKGKQAFSANGCSGRHGDEGEGGMGPQLASTEKSFPEFLSVVRKPKGVMPALNAATLPDAQVADIYAFVKSLGGGAGGAPKSSAAVPSSSTSVPEAFSATAPGNAQRGKTVFVSDGCYQCHGLVGQGATQTGAPRIGPPPIPIAAFAAYIRHPTNNMPPYTAKVVPDSDVADIYAFLQSIKAPTPGKDIPLLNQ
jgi:mono/diheme cytochrome c family protein